MVYYRPLTTTLNKHTQQLISILNDNDDLKQTMCDGSLLGRDYFEKAWRTYLSQRGILEGTGKAVFPESYGVREREKFYATLAFTNWAGSSGHDAPMIAYDALLCAGDSWEELANHGFFHGGDSDSTGVIAAAWWGATYGFKGVPQCNYKHLEYRKRMSKAALRLLELSSKPFSSEA